jgi:hypothetical protein
MDLHGKRPDPGRVAAFSILAAWTLAWKGASMWRAARDGSKPWFAALLVTNTAGILDALYLFKFSASRRAAIADAAREAAEYPQQTHTEET